MKHVKEKIDKLSPLSAGIVFGKEEAWDKLQARMDKKPARLIPLRMWLAAAAVLLLCVTIVAVLYSPVKEVAKIETDHKSIVPVNQPVDQPAAAPVGAPVTIPVTKNVAATKSNSHRTAKQKEEKQIKEPEINNIVLQQPPIKPFVGEDLAIVNNPPAQPEKKVMKVVHLNELDNLPARVLPVAAVNSTPESETRKMRVVHLNDINAQQHYLGHNTSNFAVTIPFLNSISDFSTPSNNNENHTQQHSLKFKLN